VIPLVHLSGWFVQKKGLLGFYLSAGNLLSQDFVQWKRVSRKLVESSFHGNWQETC